MFIRQDIFSCWLAIRLSVSETFITEANCPLIARVSLQSPSADSVKTFAGVVKIHVAMKERA